MWRRKKAAGPGNPEFESGTADYVSADPLEASVTWTVGSPQRQAQGYVTEISIKVENSAAAESLAVLVKAEVPLEEFRLFEAGTDPVERSSPRRLRDGRELIVIGDGVAGAYTARITTVEPAPLEVEAVLDVPMWGSA